MSFVQQQMHMCMLWTPVPAAGTSHIGNVPPQFTHAALHSLQAITPTLVMFQGKQPTVYELCRHKLQCTTACRFIGEPPGRPAELLKDAVQPG